MARDRLWLKSPDGDPKVEGCSPPCGVLFTTLMLWGEGDAGLRAAGLCFRAPLLAPGAGGGFGSSKSLPAVCS